MWILVGLLCVTSINHSWVKFSLLWEQKWLYTAVFHYMCFQSSYKDKSRISQHVKHRIWWHAAPYQGERPVPTDHVLSVVYSCNHSCSIYRIQPGVCVSFPWTLVSSAFNSISEWFLPSLKDRTVQMNDTLQHKMLNVHIYHLVH